MPKPAPVPKGEKALALYDFSAIQPGDLEFKQGDVIWVTAGNAGEAWWEGELERTGQKGPFPANYVEKQ